MEFTLEKLEPPFWWQGMKKNKLQILVYGKNIGHTIPSFDWHGVHFICVHHVENPNFLFIDIEIGKNSETGRFPIIFRYANKEIARFEFNLKRRKAGSSNRKGFDSSDVIYLIMPDRFSKGKLHNSIPDGFEKEDRDNPNGRHGGNIRGIIDKLPYLQQLGITTLWLNPFLENNMRAYSYHGYAITDFYKTDPRLGKNNEIVELSQKCHKYGLKIVMDMVFNHCGDNHWFIKDQPTNDWVHHFEQYTQTNHCITSYNDTHSSQKDAFLQENGWFDSSMPDLNQENPHLSEYLTTNSIWWIEYADLDGIRVDTYPYPKKTFMVEWNNQIFLEYPKINVVGEVWVHDSAYLAYWQKGTINRDDFNSGLPCLTDFPLRDAIVEALTQKAETDKGLFDIYNVLVKDFLFADFYNLVIFLDNHDLSRIYSVLGHNLNKFKIAISILLTIRGIPQIYYGTEFLMDGFGHDGHGQIRQDMPGGWENDELDFFKLSGLSLDEREAYRFTQKILIWRKESRHIHNGKLVHFVPEDGLYVYFRFNDYKKTMIIINIFNKRKVSLLPYSEHLNSYTLGYDIVSDAKVVLENHLRINGMSAMIIELLN